LRNSVAKGVAKDVAKDEVSFDWHLSAKLHRSAARAAVGPSTKPSSMSPRMMASTTSVEFPIETTNATPGWAWWKSNQSRRQKMTRYRLAGLDRKAATSKTGELAHCQFHSLGAIDQVARFTKQQLASFGYGNATSDTVKLRRFRLFGQLSGRNKLTASSRLLVSPFPEIKFIPVLLWGTVRLVGSRRPVGKVGKPIAFSPACP
jgi:hypothetical protein